MRLRGLAQTHASREYKVRSRGTENHPREKKPMEQAHAARHERRHIIRAFSQMLEATNKENSTETELREAVRRVAEAWSAGWLEFVGPACQRP